MMTLMQRLIFPKVTIEYLPLIGGSVTRKIEGMSYSEMKSVESERSFLDCPQTVVHLPTKMPGHILHHDVVSLYKSMCHFCLFQTQGLKVSCKPIVRSRYALYRARTMTQRRGNWTSGKLVFDLFRRS